jgi:7-cyano-7-deazaguanine synthase
MTSDSSQSPIGVLFSGGLDSACLLAQLSGQGRIVQPFYVAGGLVWQDAELAAARAFLAAAPAAALRSLVVLELPLADLYQEHWSTTRRGVPASDSPDEAVYLPGRNPLLIVKPRVWCQLNGIRQLAIGSLADNPFADATGEFFRQFEAVLDRALGGHVELLQPFALMSKREVSTLGRDYPLELTFSCLAPRSGLHCGNCNKCAERAKAFAAMGRVDPTRYALDHQPHTRTISCFE